MAGTALFLWTLWWFFQRTLMFIYSYYKITISARRIHVYL